MIEFSHIAGTHEPEGRNGSSHVIVCGNEKGGSGKSTMAIHLAIALVRLGFRVATVDLDVRQETMTRHIMYRHRFGRQPRDVLPTPTHYFLRSNVTDVSGVSDDSFTQRDFERQISFLADGVDFVVIDTPGAFTELGVMAHRVADTLLTPLNDSFIDFDVLARVDAEHFEVGELSQYALEVREARRFRQQTGGGILDWVVVRNRMSHISSKNERRVAHCLEDLSRKLGFRIAHGVAERVIFREFFEFGLTAMDDLHAVAPVREANMSTVTARSEIRKLLSALHLPIDEAGRRRAKAREQWLARRLVPAKLPDIFA